MTVLRRQHRAACGLAALLALPPAVLAGTFSISPLRVDFSGPVKTAALTVRNEDATAVVVQAEGLFWSQDGAGDALASSRDLLVSPAVFTLPPGGQQLVRVALRRAPDPDRELAYRLIVQEVPQAAAPQFTGLQVALRLSVPVFVAPAQSATRPAAMAWTAQQDTHGTLTVIARNDGPAHERIHRFTVRSGDGSRLVAEQSSLAYVLPGASRRWTFDDDEITRTDATSAAPAGIPGPYRLEGTTDRGVFATELTFTQD
ncbi:MAG TPA: molecular chaperone [Steroidobacteraceae bacterium]|nr:molecular chaperone [Steroidobacteraceae bacterium]